MTLYVQNPENVKNDFKNFHAYIFFTLEVLVKNC